jgi:hypothetical protein
MKRNWVETTDEHPVLSQEDSWPTYIPLLTDSGASTEIHYLPNTHPQLRRAPSRAGLITSVLSPRRKSLIAIIG